MPSAFSAGVQNERRKARSSNRVRVRAEDGSQGLYSYDASGRMREGRDDRAGGGADEIVSNITYDGFGNRVSETRGTTTTTYAYDAANRVTTSSAGEAWQYDAAGNITWQKNRDGSSSSSSYNAENRATITVGVDKEGKSSTSFHTYDAVGNIVNTRVEGADYGFDEVTTRDVRYLEQSKVIANSWARGARGLDGASRFEYDVNGHLTFLDRGRKQGAKENSVAVFDYDLDGQIIARADKATAHTSAEFLQGYDEDPDVTGEYDEYGNGVSTTQIVQYQLFGRTRGAIFGPIRTSANTQLQSYLYANDKPVAEGQGTQEITLKKLSLTGGVPQYGTPDPDTGIPPLTGYRLTLAASDLVMGANGQIDRAATARRIAELHYAGFIDLSQAAQAKAVAYIEGQLPADIAIGTQLSLHGYILLADANLSNVTQITDYSLRQIGADGLPAMTVQSHVVRAGDTLQSIAAMYLGSPSYWYLIADANGLQGHEALAEGTVLNIPGRIANSANSADTFKVYNESEIIGSTSPEIRTIQKKKKWYQTLIQIVIVVIMIIAAIVVSIYAPQVFGALQGGVAGVLGAAAFGAGVMAAASVVTQGLALAAGLQDSFSWKAVGQAAVGGAVSGIASVVATNTEFFGNSAAAARVAAEVGKQIVLDGRITNVAGIAAAAALGGAFRNLGTADSALRAAGNWISDNGRTFGAGLSLLESAVRGRGDNAMQWVSLATSALFDSGAVRAQILTDAGAGAGSLNWQYVAVQAVGSAIVGGHMGGSAGASYFGNAIGSGIGEHMYERQARANDPLGAFIEQQVAAQNRRDMYGLTSVGTPRLGQVSYGPRLDAKANDDPLDDLIARNNGWAGVSATPTFAEDRAARDLARNPMGLPTFSASSNVTQQDEANLRFGQAYTPDFSRANALLDSASGLTPDMSAKDAQSLASSLGLTGLDPRAPGVQVAMGPAAAFVGVGSGGAGGAAGGMGVAGGYQVTRPAGAGGPPGYDPRTDMPLGSPGLQIPNPLAVSPPPSIGENQSWSDILMGGLPLPVRVLGSALDNLIYNSSSSVADQAAALGYDRVVKDPPFYSHGQKVFTNGKDFITPDADVHKGGVERI